MVDFEILGGDTFRRLRLDNLEVDIVGFGNRKDGDRPRVGLGEKAESVWRAQALWGAKSGISHRVGVELSESHGGRTGDGSNLD